MSYPYMVLQPVGLTQADEWVRIGFEAHAAYDLLKAEKQYIRALGRDPSHAIATNNLGLVELGLGRLHFAVLALERATIYAPDHPIIWANYAFVLMAADRPEDAWRAAETAMALAAPHPKGELERSGYILSRQAMAICSASFGFADVAAPLYAEALALDQRNFGVGIGSCFLPSLRDIGPEQALPIRAAWRAAHGYKGPPTQHRNDKNPDRPLRVGYVSGDFRTHSASMIFSQVLLKHSPAVVPYFYSTLPINAETDSLSLEFMKCAGRMKEDPDDDGPPILIEQGHRWRDISSKSDDEAVTMIWDDEIDVLVDLSGHTNGNRLTIFTRKPAPVQVTAWGFAVGTGLPEIDAFLADPVTVPQDERKWYAEDVVYLPCIVTYRPPDEYGFPGSTPLPYHMNEFVTFGCFGRFEKLSETYLNAVRTILQRVPNSRAYFKDRSFLRPDHVRRVRDALGVEPSRVWCGLATPHVEHIKAYQDCDLMLDTFPHGMGETILEATYMGVPAVTKYGKSPPGRLAASIYNVIGRTEWIASTDREYIEKAVIMALEPEKLREPRKTLRQELVESPVVKGYVSAVEDAYRWCWRKWCMRPEQ